MDNLGKHALLFAANLSLPTVIAVNANLGCAHCRQRVTQVISKMAGRKRFVVWQQHLCVEYHDQATLQRKQVIVKGDMRFNKRKGADDVPKKKAENSTIVDTVFKFFIRSFGFLRIRKRS